MFLGETVLKKYEFERSRYQRHDISVTISASRYQRHDISVTISASRYQGHDIRVTISGLKSKIYQNRINVKNAISLRSSHMCNAQDLLCNTQIRLYINP